MHIISRLHSNRMQYMYCSAGLLPMTYPIYRFVLTTGYRNRNESRNELHTYCKCTNTVRLALHQGFCCLTQLVSPLLPGSGTEVWPLWQ